MRLLLPHPRALSAADLLDLYDPGAVPHLRVGFVLSTDGAVTVDGGSRGLQSPADQVAFHALRAVCDAVVVGAGTARSEGYGPVQPRPDGALWRAARGLPARPPLVLVSRSLDLPAQVLHHDTVILTCGAAPAGRRRELSGKVAAVVVVGADDLDLAAAVQALRERGLTRLLCEGGPGLLTALLQDGLVDELCLTHAPLLVGAGPGLLTSGLLPPSRLGLRHLIDGDDGVLLARWKVEPETSAT